MTSTIHQTKSGERLSLSKLFEVKKYEIVIPIIQRDYAQGRDTNEEIRNGFLNALKKYLEEGKPNRDLDFIYGSLIDEGAGINPRFVPLDGQQRLTTLFLMHWYLASKEDKVQYFRNVFAKQLSDNKWRSKFTYETRASATEFCNALVSANIDFTNIGSSDEEFQSLSEKIKNQQWYFLSWRNDPTIRGMLVMLDAIHDLFKNEDKSFYQLLTDTDNPIITFQFLKLEEFGLTDDLYIKMNSRGKPLTQFENFKAKFEKQIKQPEFNTKDYLLGSNGKKRTVSLHVYFSHKIDTAWANLFWAYSKDQSKNEKENITSYDDIIMNLLKTFATNFVAGKDNTDKHVRDLIKIDSKDLTFNQFKQLNCFDSESVPNLIILLDCLQNENNKARQYIPNFYYYDESTLEKLLLDKSNTAEYVDRIMFHAYAQYLIIHPPSQETSYTDNLKKWMRVIHNLTESTAPYNSEKEFSNSIKGINSVIKSSYSIHEYLIQGGAISGFDKDQNAEEQMKASLIKRASGWSNLIFEAEQYDYFKGQIGFLLRLCGVTDYYNNNKNYDWNEEQDEILKQSFIEFFEKSQAIFDDNGLRRAISVNGNYIWERALLSIGDYLIWEGQNKSFLINKDRDISWKRLLKGDKNKSHPAIISNVFNAVEINNLKGSLESIRTKSTVSGWRKAFIDTPELFNYLGNKRYVRPNSEHGFVLFKGERMNGAHAELFSRKLFHDYFENKQTKPFEKCKYHDPAGTESSNMPCVILKDWGDTQYQMNILFRDSNFEIWLLNTGTEPISEIISELTTGTDFKMELSEMYGCSGYVMKKEQELEAIEFIYSLCIRLRSLQL